MSDLLGLTFEQALKELELLVHQLEDGSTTLEEAVTAYEKGLSLKVYCEDKLNQAHLRVEKIGIQAQKQNEPESSLPSEGKATLFEENL